MCFGTCLQTSKVFKFSFIPFNIVIMLLCMAVLVLSCIKLHVVAGYTSLTGGYGADERHISTWFVVLSVVELLLAAFGILVAVRQTSNYVAGYFILGVLVACALMSTAVYQLSGESGMCDAVADAMLYYMNYYKDNYHVQGDIDRGQREKECCGANSYEDWLSLPSNFSLTDVPKTCCLPHALFSHPSDCNVNVLEQATHNTLNKSIYERGCVDSYVQELGRLPQDSGIMMTTIAVMQFGALVAIVLVYGRQFSESVQQARNSMV